MITGLYAYYQKHSLATQGDANVIGMTFLFQVSNVRSDAFFKLIGNIVPCSNFNIFDDYCPHNS